MLLVWHFIKLYKYSSNENSVRIANNDNSTTTQMDQKDFLKAGVCVCLCVCED